ncbi:MAG: RecQ family ATP-dependent DNA helicase [Ardenticatenaceae bacterium]
MALLHKKLHSLFGFSSFLPGQQETIELLLAGHDVLCILPTGAGKSLIYQLLAHLLYEQGRGVTIVVSPLIALMKDQADALRRRSWTSVGVLNSHIGVQKQAKTLARLRAGELSLLYVTPERLESATFLQHLFNVQVALLAVDEAHCISQWGNDFRTAFLRLDEAVYAIRQSQAQAISVLALTATAPPPVQAEIIEKLRLKEPKTVVTGFERDNLMLEVAHIPNESGKWAAFGRRLGPNAQGKGKGLKAPGIIYSATVRDTEPIAQKLREWGWKAAVYHGQMKKATRQRVQNAFMAGQSQIVVATNAFGLGINKKNLRFVLHWNLPGSPETYYQEAGRAGRDGQPASCLLFYCPQDRHLQAFFARQSGPSEHDVRLLWATLGRIYQSQPLPLASLAKAMKRKPGEVERLLLPLEENGYLSRSQDGKLTVHQIVPPSLLQLSMTQSTKRQAYNQSRLKMIETYALTTDCRHEFLLNYLGQAFDTDNCGRCDNCLQGRSILQSELGLPFHTGDIVQHPTWGLGTVQRLERSHGVTVLFDKVGYKTIALAVWQHNQGLLERIA